MKLSGGKKYLEQQQKILVFFSLALRGECDIVDGNVAALLALHGCLDCHREGFARVGESDVDLGIKKKDKIKKRKIRK